MNKIAIYIHVPFCIKKCNYCDFVSFPLCNNYDEDLLSFYIKELSLYRELIGNRYVETLYFGGGTPSLMSSQFIEKIIECIYENFTVCNNPEITLEVNPKTVDEQKLKDFYTAGVNRLSIGIQSFDDNELCFLGRVHNSYDAKKTIELATKYFDNINCDFIYAIPNQSFETWQKNLVEISKLPVQHLSIYQLIIEPKTPIYSNLKKRIIRPIDDNLAVKMFEYTNKFFKKTFPQYEISNYAKPKFQSRHNLNYWDGGDYIGIGVSAVSRFKLENKFYGVDNEKKINLWQNRVAENKIPFYKISKFARAKELLIMGLRKNSGIDISNFNFITDTDFWDIVDKNKVLNFCKMKFLHLSNTHLKPLIKGRNILNSIIEQIVK